MSNIKESLKQAMEIDGAVAVALVDYNSGMTLGTAGGSNMFDLDVAAAGNTDVVRAKMAVMSKLGLKDRIEDILITLGIQYHLIRLIAGPHGEGVFLYLVLTKAQSNLAMARRELRSIEQRIFF